MAVRIRLARHGRLHRPFFRIVAIDGRCHREGASNEILGIYDPLLKEKTVTVDIDRVKHWVDHGAQISQSLTRLLQHQGYIVPTTSNAAVAAPAKPDGAAKATTAPKPSAKLNKPVAKLVAGATKAKYGTATRRSAKAHQAKLKATRKAADAAAKAAAPAAAEATPSA